MKTRSMLLVVVLLLSIVLVVAGCGGSTAATTSSAPPPTTSATSSTTPPPSTSPVVVSTTPAGGTLPATAPAITDHNLAALNNYKGYCLMCHAAGASNAAPTAPSWNGATSASTTHTGTYTIVAGSPADHTGRTADICTQAGCHAAPTT